MQRRDYLEQLIERIAAAVARVVGLAREGRHEEAERALDEAWTTALGFRRADVQRLDPGTLRAMLGARASPAAELVRAEAEVAEARGDAAAAASLRALAARLR
jgi:hypothetical protein